MSVPATHFRMDPERFPDQGPCCWGAVHRGHEGCTCWEPVYDAEQAPPRPGPMEPRKSMCNDCAFRVGSPERRGDPDYRHAGEVLDLPFQPVLFCCHEGMRRVVEWRHPSGAIVTGRPGEYHPPEENGTAYRADGSPALVCAGFHHRRRNVPVGPEE